MLEMITISGLDRIVEEIEAEVARACRRIPPLWDLPNYVAVNPFLGFAERPLAEAARLVADGLGGQLLPGLDFYRARWREGAFGSAELARAAERADQDPAALEAILHGTAPMPLRPASEAITFAERHDRRYGSAWNELVLRHVAQFCAVQLGADNARWARPAHPGGLYAAWREAAMVDRSLEIEGLAGWRSWVAALPAESSEALALMVEWLEVGQGAREDYFYRLLGGVYGWASLLRRNSWQAADADPVELRELLAIRICADAAVARLAPRTARVLTAHSPALEDEAVRLIFQEALEDGYAGRMLSALANAENRTPAARPALQSVFCIDVRSEPLRRQLEAQDAAIETRGFAGFFGLSLDWQTDGLNSARCPVLLSPALPLRALAPAPALPQGLLKHIQAAPAAAFSFVELLGLAYGLTLAGDALTARSSGQPDEEGAAFEVGPVGGLSLAERLDFAAGMLKNMGLRERVARLVLLCGHESCSENNPHDAGLDCGACGGHGGALNARVAAALLNDADVRAQLPTRGFQLPDDTWFVAGLHDTSCDEVRLLDTSLVPASHQAELTELQTWLASAGAAVRAERAPALGLGTRPAGLLARLLNRRARDWSETRPEWALARNAAFIAARRQRTRGVDLEGRAFLHEYDWTLDADGSILSLILAAPMVVASWINLQYMASTVDNRVFGCGTKALHNRVGTLGVVLGNAGDLRTGLAAQSVHAADGSWYHEPLRLQVVVEAPQEKISAALEALPQVRALIDNGWLRLFALDPASSAVARYTPGEGWII